MCLCICLPLWFIQLIAQQHLLSAQKCSKQRQITKKFINCNVCQMLKYNCTHMYIHTYIVQMYSIMSWHWPGSKSGDKDWCKSEMYIQYTHALTYTHTYIQSSPRSLCEWVRTCPWLSLCICVWVRNSFRLLWIVLLSMLLAFSALWLVTFCTRVFFFFFVFIFKRRAFLLSRLLQAFVKIAIFQMSDD